MSCSARHSARRPTFTVHPELRQTIIETERLPRNDEPTSHALLSDIKLECYEDGYPKLPECLDRRPRLPILKAAYAGCLVQPREWRQRKRARRLGGLSPRLFIAARACRSAPPTLRPPDKKKPRSRGGGPGLFGFHMGGTSDDEGRSPQQSNSDPGPKFHSLLCDIFSTSRRQSIS